MLLEAVTGSGSGIGEDIARAMAANGDRATVADANWAAAVSVATAVGGEHHRLDVPVRAECDALAGRIGPVDILVNDAGINRRGERESGSARAGWGATMAVNLD